MKDMKDMKDNKESKRLNIGIDVSKKTLDVAYWDEDRDKAVYQGKFSNTQKGFDTITQKIERLCERQYKGNGADTTTGVIVSIVMEPTGGYEQRFARFAIEREWEVSLPNPYRVKLWAGAMGIRAKTDPHDARTLAHYGFKQDTHQWKPLPFDVEQLNFLERHILQNQMAIKEYLKANPHLKEQKKILLTVPGVGEKNVLHILVMLHRWMTLTNGEAEIKSLVACVGLDPKPHVSGTSVRRRTGISRQGNREFRSRLYMSALGGISGNSPLSAFYDPLVG